MTPEAITHLLVETIYLILILSMPAVGIGALIGLLVGLFQGLTQIQDQTLSFALRLVGSAVMLAITAPWMASKIDIYADKIYKLMSIS